MQNWLMGSEERELSRLFSYITFTKDLKMSITFTKKLGETGGSAD